MKLQFETIARNLQIPPQSNVVVQFWGKTKDRTDLNYFVETLSQEHQQVTGILFNQETILKACEEGAFSIDDQISDTALSEANVIVDLCAYSPTSLVQFTTAESRPNFVTFMRGHFQKITGPDKLMVQIRIPSEENAEEAGLDLESYTQYYKDMVMVDYDDLNNRCLEKIKAYQDAKTATIVSKNGHELTLTFEGRSWFKDAGEGDFPAGEIYIAPLENSANGTYCVDQVYWEGERFFDVVLTFKDGQLIDSSEPQIIDDLKMADENALTIAEFGIGMNPMIQTLTGHSLFDEKIQGSCHIAIGMNALFGGVNESAVHIDFVSLKPTVTID